jgi:hypothetical protein
MLKIFIKTDELNQKNPRVMASYQAERTPTINENTHPGMTMFVIPEIPFKMTKEHPGDFPGSLPIMPDGWKETLGPHIMNGEAQKRIAEVLPPEDQMLSLYELLDMLLQHGTNVTKWPTSAQNRKAEIADAWDYAREVTARASNFKMMPATVDSDKNWPARPAAVKKSKKKS